jgi:hypothetical protein
MTMSGAHKIDPSKEVPYRCVAVAAGESSASFRLCVAVREHADVAAGHLFLLRQVHGARAVLGAMCDAAGQVREWLEIWVQDVEAPASSETLIPSCKANDKAWELLVKQLREADPEGAFSSVFEKAPSRPAFVDLAKWQPWHPATESGEIQVCRDDAALAAAGLPKYSESGARFGRASGGGAFVSLNEAARGANGTVELRTLLPASVEWVALNPGGGMIFARRFAPLGLEEFAELLGGRPWTGIVNARRPFRLRGVYRHLEDEMEMRAAGFHFYGSRRNQSGRMAEVLCLKLLLLDQCVREVSGEVRRTGLPLLNVTPDSFRVSLGDTSANLPFCWASKVALVQPGDAIALDVPSSKTRYFTTRTPASASIYRPEELGVPRRGIGNVRLRRVFSPAEGGIAAEGTLTSHERLNVQPNELLRIRLPLKDAGSVELIGYLDSKAALAAGEAAFRTIPLLLSEEHTATLRSYEGIPFSQIPFEVLQPLNSPCDLYALGVLALRLLYAGSELSLPIILDTALSLLRAASEEQAETPLESRILNLLRTDERWLAALGTQHLIRPAAEGEAVVAGSLPEEVWSRVLATILPFFPGRSPESFCRDLSDGPTLAPQKVFEPALEAIERTLNIVRTMFLSDWTYNEEMTEILSPYMVEEAAPPHP